MELTESIESINQQLIDEYGIDTITKQSMFRVVWSEDQYEKRLTDFTDEGFQLLHPEVRLLPKYRQWLPEQYVLENLVLVPEVSQHEIPESKLSYEPLYPFQSDAGDPLPPTFWACKFCIDTVRAAMGKKTLRKYVDNSHTPEEKIKRINKLQKELFGNETDVGDALAQKSGVGYTGPNKVTLD